MARPIHFAGANATLGAPAGNEHNVEPLHVFRNGRVCVSCWELTPEEIAAGVVFLSVYSGPTQPPVMVADEGATRSVLADTGGVWKK
jgi:hypothetical protein